MFKIISETFETERLIISEATMNDERTLQDICFTWENKVFIEGDAFQSDYIKNCLENGDLPPTSEACKENYRLKKITLKDTGEIIGFFDLYYGYPSSNSIYISILLIDSKKQKMNYGKEVVEKIIYEGRLSSFEKIALGVQLKNWKALKFWINLGFNKILGYYGSTTLSEDTIAMIGLEKSLL